MQKNREFIICLVGMIGLMLGGCQKEETLQIETVTQALQQESVTETEGQYFIYICGEVKKPGVYKLDADARLYEAVDAAGGMTKQAAKEQVNLAARLTDGQQIYIPSRNNDTAAGISVQESTADDRVNINNADLELLQTLPGIGEAKAAAIIAYREAHGAFSTPEDIMQVSGIKEAAYNKLKDKIKTE